jgi:hypothetical protein
MAPPVRSVSGVIDVPLTDLDDAVAQDAADIVRRSLGYDIANTEWGRALTEKVELCHEDHLKRKARRSWVTAIAATLAGSIFTGLVYVGRALDARGAAAEAERVRAELVRRHEDQIRELQSKQAATDAVLRILSRAAATNQ